MLDQLLLHEVTKASLCSLVSNPPQGVLLIGPEGVGKLSVAQALSLSLVQHPTDARTISPDDKGTISIDTIRELYKASRAKQNGQQVIILERADSMSLEAENAFLKLLEEPRAGLTFILTALQIESLLPTITSRVQRITLQPLPDNLIRQFIQSKQPNIPANDLNQLVFIAQGRPGTAMTLLGQDMLPKQREVMQLVKQLISAPPYERFVLATKLTASRADSLATLSALSRVVEAQLGSASTAAPVKYWSNIADATDEALNAISHNGNVRAQLLYLLSRY